MDIGLSLITALFIGGIAGYLGSLMVTEKMALVGGPMGHLALPGVALAILYGFNIFWGGLATIVLGSVLIWLFSLRTKLSLEAITAVVFAGTVALGFLILPIEEAEKALIGDIRAVGLFDAVLAVAVGVLVYFTVRGIYSKVVLSGLSDDLALARGVNVKGSRLVYLAAIAVVVAMEVKIVGVLLTAALVAIPAGAARNFSRNLTQYTWLSLIIGGLSAVLGVFLFEITGLPAGPLIILTGMVFFLGSLLFSKKD
jgi:ABC-type Mn2+/Zn2+ transport system permease subunit